MTDRALSDSREASRPRRPKTLRPVSTAAWDAFIGSYLSSGTRPTVDRFLFGLASLNGPPGVPDDARNGVSLS